MGKCFCGEETNERGYICKDCEELATQGAISLLRLANDFYTKGFRDGIETRKKSELGLDTLKGVIVWKKS